MRNGLIITENGTKSWYQNNLLHQTDGPAIEFADGDKEWYQNGELHRIDGPAIEYPNGNHFWYQNNQLHRTDGPAVEYTDGERYWYIKGIRYSFDQWLEHTDYTEAQKTLMRLQYA